MSKGYSGFGCRAKVSSSGFPVSEGCLGLFGVVQSCFAAWWYPFAFLFCYEVPSKRGALIVVWFLGYLGCVLLLGAFVFQESVLRVTGFKPSGVGIKVAQTCRVSA